ncbi:unnamed protein product [Sphenostylis stenocarpa]|uniref:Protein kinase domain-containing protein n=1 Tax=Sphenostylis stenocarpa TaxID=92480 RepID=A0AA86V9U7_9FABA|nr:unnamed protein product [Sphenostylis stenocarpa]
MASASPPSPSLLLLLFATAISLSFQLSPVVHSTNSDFHALMSFKAASDPSNTLAQWNSTTSNPCNWYGVSCLRNRVSRLVLQDLNLTGSILPLTSLTQLRILSLKRNSFSGPITSLANLTALRLLFLSHNNFSGHLPAALISLYRLDLSHNSLSGEIPTTLNLWTHLLTLRLDHNRLRGRIPSTINLSHLQDFNVSNNLLSGEIPESLSGLPGSAFSHNPSLCGAPLRECKGKAIIPALASPLKPQNDTVFYKPRGGERMGVVVLIGFVVSDVLVLGLVSVLLYWYFWRKYSGATELRNEGKENGGGGMVVLEGGRRFELEELLRASAEMLGKGAFGSSYKAVVDDGSVVAVKRVTEVSVGGKKEFHDRMQELGRLRHCNLVSLRAYYFSKHHNFLVSDFMPNHSFSSLLHGNRGPGRSPVDWSTRLKIVAGAARGVAFIHSHKLTHGNIKSTNVLIDVAGNGRVADFGLSIFAPASALSSNGYRAPELSDPRKQTQMSDVYSFGVLLMEMLTGKCPSAVDGGHEEAVDLPRWVRSVVREDWTAEVFDLELLSYKDIEEEMVALLQIAMACTAAAPDQRPRMSHVVKMIEELRGVQVSPGHDALDMVSESLSVAEDAACTGGGPSGF